MKYLCRISYVGTHFCGFQYQPARRTVQGVFTDAARAVFGREVAVTGCSRTDSGVHAEGFCLTIALPDGTLPIPPERLHLAFVPHLPPDLCLLSAMAVGDGFHPRYDAVAKEYRYRILHAPLLDPFLYQRVWQVKSPFLSEALEKMNEAAARLCGTHDFDAFRAEGSPVHTTVRTIFDCHVTKDGDIYTLSVTGDGFLYNMVRIITGTLVAVATGKLTPSRVGEILASRKRTEAGMTAPPDGLYLHRVVYNTEDFSKETRE